MVLVNAHLDKTDTRFVATHINTIHILPGHLILEDIVVSQPSDELSSL